MPELVSFEGFKFKKTEFRFKNKKDMNKFFDDALIESTHKFIRLTDKMTLERMHIIFSWYMLLKIMAYSFVALSFITLFFNTPILYFIAGSSLLSLLFSAILSKRLDKMAFGRNFFNEIANNTDSIENIRQELINKNS